MHETSRIILCNSGLNYELKTERQESRTNTAVVWQLFLPNALYNNNVKLRFVVVRVGFDNLIASVT